MAKAEAVADAPMGRRRRLVLFQFAPTPYFPVYGVFKLRGKTKSRRRRPVGPSPTASPCLGC
ncbi:hypothetical protein HanRHA438_Chr10g0468931 [Helianthus annuus]|nr:hypothetical protein HanRHA438_Chr10g0468931 [Helianthus annuus]